MKILLITEYFSPISAVAAIRATKLAKYLSRRGHQVTVLCREWDEHVPADLNLQRDEKEVYKVLHVRNSPFFTAIADLAVSCADQAVPGSGTPPQTAEQTQAPGLLSRVIVQCSRWMEMQKSLNYACQAKVLKRNCTEKFDVVISTYGPFSSHILGLYAKKKHGGCWIADYRDALLYVQGARSSLPGADGFKKGCGAC